MQICGCLSRRAAGFSALTAESRPLPSPYCPKSSVSATLSPYDQTDACRYRVRIVAIHTVDHWRIHLRDLQG